MAGELGVCLRSGLLQADAGPRDHHLPAGPLAGHARAYQQRWCALLPYVWTQALGVRHQASANTQEVVHGNHPSVLMWGDCQPSHLPCPAGKEELGAVAVACMF